MASFASHKFPFDGIPFIFGGPPEVPITVHARVPPLCATCKCREALAGRSECGSCSHARANPPLPVQPRRPRGF